ncbi:MAG: hypothetical protein RLZZ568_2367 [Cyanobacteriota bacterium]
MDLTLKKRSANTASYSIPLGFVGHHLSHSPLDHSTVRH